MRHGHLCSKPFFHITTQSIFFFSGGTLASEGMELPKITKYFAKSLGLPNLKDYSNNAQNQGQLVREADLLLGADNLTCQMLEQMYPGKHVRSIEKRAMEMGVRLVDPVNSVGYEFNHLLGKFLYFGFSSFQESESQNNKFPISALIANKDNIFNELKILLESLAINQAKPLIVDCNFKFATKGEYLGLVPRSQQYECPSNLILNLNGQDLSSISLITPSHEVTAWESFIAAPEWRRWLINLSRSRPVVLLCTPVDIIEGEKHNSFLEALNSDHLTYRV